VITPILGLLSGCLQPPAHSSPSPRVAALASTPDYVKQVTFSPADLNPGMQQARCHVMRLFNVTATDPPGRPPPPHKVRHPKLSSETAILS